MWYIVWFSEYQMSTRVTVIKAFSICKVHRRAQALPMFTHVFRVVTQQDVPPCLSHREKYAMMFDEPVLLQQGWWYVAWARVSGPSSDCGSHGQATITTDDRYDRPLHSGDDMRMTVSIPFMLALVTFL